MKLYSPVAVNFKRALPDKNFGINQAISQQDAAQYLNKIHDIFISERLPRDAERGQMSYYYGGGSVDEKVRRLEFDVEVHDGKLWAAATLDISEPLTPSELDTIRGFIRKQYALGYGEGFKEIDINVDGGMINVHLWTAGDDFFIDTEREFEKRIRPDVSTTEEHTGEILSPAQMALNEPGIFDEDIDCVETSAYMSMLTDRVNANYIEYIDRLRGMDDGDITDYTSEIARVSEAHYFLTERFNFHFSELDYLLKFKDPLMVVVEAFSADIDKEHSAVMWKIFHEQDALKNGRYSMESDVLDESGAPTAEALKQELFDRLDKNLSDYRDTMMSNSKQFVYDMAEDIAVKFAALEYMKTGYDYKTGEVEFLLQFQNPLALVVDNWPSTLDGLIDMTAVISGIFDDRSSHGHYALVVYADNPTAKEKGRGPESTEKQSVIERIRASEKEPRQHRKDKSSRDKSEPEH